MSQFIFETDKIRDGFGTKSRGNFIMSKELTIIQPNTRGRKRKKERRHMLNLSDLSHLFD